VKVWDVLSGQQVGHTFTSNGGIEGVDFSYADGGATLCAITKEPSELVVYDYNTGKNLRSTAVTEATEVVVVPDHRGLVVWKNDESDSKVHVLDWNTLKELGELHGTGSWGRFEWAFDAQHGHLVILDEKKGKVQAFDLATFNSVPHPHRSTQYLARNSNKELVGEISIDSNKHIAVWDTNADQALKTPLNCEVSQSYSVGNFSIFEQGGGHIVFQHFSSLEFWDLRTGLRELASEPPKHASCPDNRSLCAIARGGVVVVASISGQVWILHPLH